AVVLGRVPGRRARHLAGVAASGSRGARRGRRGRRAYGAVPGRDDVPGRPGPQPGAERVRPDERGRPGGPGGPPAGALSPTAASLAGGLATSQAWLLAARAVQGAGGAIVAPTALSLVATTFPEDRARNRAMSVYAAMSVAGGVIGLIAGGLLVTYASWR